MSEERPKPEPEQLETLGPGGTSARQARGVLEAGLAAAFGRDEAVVVGHAGHSVLKAMEQTVDMPRVMLREPTTGHDPVVRPASPEIPQRDSDSRYQLQGEIARGGMGAVLKGRDTDLGRDLAIKVLLDVHKDKPDVVQRFIEEAQIGGQLQHPGIAPVYELGQFADRRPFFSMKLVRGETLAKLLSDRSDVVAERGKYLKIFEQICQTLAYAHSRGVIHRDLKPANVMVGAFGEVQVMDWGLAKVLTTGGVVDEKKARETHAGRESIRTLRDGVGSQVPSAGSSSSQTIMGSVMGTPSYMPPEQALGDIGHMDERSDVFGLGAILCEILTGKPPYVGPDGKTVFELATHAKLEDCFARLEGCGADADLIALARQCLALEPNDRPRDAAVLAERVTKHLESVDAKLRETELARAAEAARAEQQQKSARKLRKMVMGLAALAAIAIGSSIVAGEFWQSASAAKVKAEVAGDLAQKNAVTAQREAARANQQKIVAEENLINEQKAEKEATAQRNRANDAVETTTQNLYYAQMHVAGQSWREHRGIPRMTSLLQNWVPQDDSATDRRGWEWYFVRSLPYQNVQRLAEKRTLGFECTVAWNAATNRLAEGGRTGSIQVWDVATQKVVLTLNAPERWIQFWGNQWLAWNPDGSLLATGYKDGTVHLWDGAGREVRVLRPADKAPVVWVEFSADGARLAVFGERGKITVWDVSAGTVAAAIDRKATLTAAAWSADNQLLATGHRDGTVTISGIDGAHQSTLRAHLDTIYHLSFSPDGKRLATTSGSDFFVSIWDVETQKKLMGPLRHSHGICSMAWEPDGKRLATGSMDETIKLWDTDNGKELLTLRGAEEANCSLSWGPGGRLASGCADGSVRIWNTDHEQESRVLTCGKRATAVAWSPDGKQLASGSDDGQVRIWNPPSADEIATFDAHDPAKVIGQYGLIRQVAWSPDGTYAASAGLDGVAKVFDVKAEREVYALPNEHGAVWCVAWSRDGKTLAAGAADGTICLVHGIPDAPQVRTIPAHVPGPWGTAKIGVRSLAWSPTADRLASCGGDRRCKVWDPAEGVELVRMRINVNVSHVAWSPDGTQIASGDVNRDVILWDANSGKPIHVMHGHGDWVDSVAWSPDGKRIASAGLDNSVRIWDPATGEATFALRGEAGFFTDVSWNRDGSRIAAACSDGRVWIWDATKGYELEKTDAASR